MEMKKDLGLIKDEDDKETDKVERKKGRKHKRKWQMIMRN